MIHPGQHRLAKDATDEFRHGMAYAMHLIRHAAGGVHGFEISPALAQLESNDCCRRAVLSFVDGVATGVEEVAATHVGPHDHGGLNGVVVATS